MSEIFADLASLEKTFGHNFVMINDKYQYDSTEGFIKKYQIIMKINSEQAINSFNYLEPYIKRGVFPNKKTDKTCNISMLGLYSFIADRQEFDGIEGDFFYGFLSLKKYHHLDENLWCIFYNKEDNIKLYVYLNQFDMEKKASFYKVKPNKSFSFFHKEGMKESENHKDPYLFFIKEVYM
jgi:hypothetical protein